MTYDEARASIPENAVWSSSFGNPGEAGYTEYWRSPTHGHATRFVIENGLHDARQWRARRIGAD
jgi:hypothetical protein